MAGAGTAFGQPALHGFAASGTGRGVWLGRGLGAGGDAVAGKGFGKASPGEEFGMGAFELAVEHHLEAGDKHGEGAGRHERIGGVEPAGEFGALGQDVEGYVAVEVGAVVGPVETDGEHGAGVGVGFGPGGFVGKQQEGAEVAGKLGKGGAGHVEKTHLGLAGGGPAGVAFGDVGGGGPGGHGHLVEEASARVDAAVEVFEAEAAYGMLDEGRQEPGVEPVVGKGGFEGCGRSGRLLIGRGVHGGAECSGGRGRGARGKWRGARWGGVQGGGRRGRRGLSRESMESIVSMESVFSVGWAGGPRTSRPPVRRRPEWL